MSRLRTRFRKAEDSPGFLLWKAANVLQRKHAGCLSHLNVTPAQFSLMTCLVHLHDHGPVTAARIVEQSGMDKMMVSDLVKTLTRKGLMRRRPNPDDGRSFLLEPTGRGRKATNSAVAEIEKLDDLFFSGVKNLGLFQETLDALIRGDRAES